MFTCLRPVYGRTPSVIPLSRNADDSAPAVLPIQIYPSTFLVEVMEEKALRYWNGGPAAEPGKGQMGNLSQNYYPPKPTQTKAPDTPLVMDYERERHRPWPKPVVARDPALLTNEKNPKAVAEVMAGQRAVANAAWWRFDKKDATKALQSALDSQATKVVIPIYRRHIMSAALALLWVAASVIGCLLVASAAEAEAGSGSTLPDYRWVVDEQKVIVRAEHVGEQEATASVVVEGLTFAKNGDLLLAACTWMHQRGMPNKEINKTVILRSSDRGHTWTKQGVLEHRKTPLGLQGGGFTEGMSRLRSGRLVIIYYAYEPPPSGPPRAEYFIPGGVNRSFKRRRSAQWGVYSDDEGKTWHYAPMDISPFLAASFHSGTQIFEAEDGTLVASFSGHLSQEELDSGITSCGIVRSHDAGLTWDDASIIQRAQPGSGLQWTENQVIPLGDGRWLCKVRLNDYTLVNLPRGQYRCYSYDQGHTWSYPVRTHFFGGESGLGMLPDGAVISGQTEPLNWRTTEVGLRYEVSYDGGLTWYTAPLYFQQSGSGEHRGSLIFRPLDDETVLAVYHRGSQKLIEKYGRSHQGYGPLFIGATWLRKVPADSPRAAKLTYPGQNDLLCNMDSSGRPVHDY